MNLFVLDLDPIKAAQYHCDKHVVKMVLETAQILCTVHHQLDSAPSSTLYKPTHKAHPCVVWAGTNRANYRWTYQLFCALADEYTHRYGGHHTSFVKLHELLQWFPSELPNAKRRTPFAQAMPDQYRRPGEPVVAYRSYYVGEKQRMLKYTRRQPPDWLTLAVSLDRYTSIAIGENHGS